MYRDHKLNVVSSHPRRCTQGRRRPAGGGWPRGPGIWVQGEEGAKAYMVAAGNSVLLMDSENSAFYIKSTDASGMPLPLRVFDYKERTTATKMPPQTAQQPGGEFVTRAEFDALAARCAALEKQDPAKTETEVK